ncbi:MAG: polysaccharide biosynthesis/export family protein [Candidatus Omnitrophica bacterium]|jgi:polysaccharide export outer membrane protein|nr:polysaccharide biosynthesis/export family protein [Candidatus Omnitrophota bacterium]MDD5078702.1 polysaccharide biosynthesis/export family protein [Candidatus Omnitrophota bacterium]MDD5080243.1 polysaccharide biosynthesis/export family protein [Candidatus Omnitrophota bacterium]
MNAKIKNIILLALIVLVVPAFINAADDQEQAKDYYRLGNIYYQQGRYTEAEEQYQKAMDLMKANDLAAVVVSDKQPVANKVAAVSSAPAVAAAEPKTGGAVEYLIGDEDILYISVWQNPDLTQDVIVRPDGMVSFPLIGDIQATGLTITQLDNAVTERLQEFIKYPEVSISIKTIGGSRVVILGQVSSPGVYSVAGKRSIMEAVGMAGGFTRDAVPSSTVLIRGGFKGPDAQRINLSKVFKGDLSKNIILQSQDIIFIPRKFISDVNYFLSQVLDPLSKGAYTNRELRSW